MPKKGKKKQKMKKPVGFFVCFFKVQQHANQFVHSIDFDHATITANKAVIFTRDIFLRPGIRKDSNEGNEHDDMPDVTNPLCGHA